MWWKRCKERYEAKKPIIGRVWYEAWRPLVLGIAWGALVVWCYQGKSLLDSFSAGFAAFFFTFFLQGQVLRVSKNVRDEDNASEFRNRFASIQEGVDALRTQTAAHPQPPGHPRPVPSEATSDAFREAESLIKQARMSLANNLYYPAVLTAAVGFEHELRMAAARLDMSPNRLTLGAIIRQMVAQTSRDDMLQRLETLVRLRNGLVHPNPDSANISEAEATDIVNAFQEGIEWVEQQVESYFTNYVTPSLQLRT
jgi:hypothetical protein